MAITLALLGSALISCSGRFHINRHLSFNLRLYCDFFDRLTTRRRLVGSNNIVGNVSTKSREAKRTSLFHGKPNRLQLRERTDAVAQCCR